MKPKKLPPRLLFVEDKKYLRSESELHAKTFPDIWREILALPREALFIDDNIEAEWGGGLQRLLNDTREIIEASDFEVPSDPEASLVALDMSDLDIDKSDRSTQDAINRFIEKYEVRAAEAAKPQQKLYRAYALLKRVEALTEAGRFESAVNELAHGASALVTAVASLYAEQRRKGGIQKLKKNSTAMAKQIAIAASKKLWAQREQGLHPKLRTEDQFAMEVARRWPEITSLSAIKQRSREWRKEKTKRRDT